MGVASDVTKNYNLTANSQINAYGISIPSSTVFPELLLQVVL